MLKSIVREALVTSVAWTLPPVRFQISQESTVPKRSRPAWALRRAPGTFSRIQWILVALKYASMISPVLSRIISSRPLALRLLQYSAVRRSCHTIALQMGRPLSASQTTVVSRWLAMPSATTGPSVTSATARFITLRIEDQISIGFCSTHPCRGKS